MRSHAKASSAGSSTRHGSRLGAVIRGAFATRSASGNDDGSGAPAGRPVLLALIAALALAAFAGIGASAASAAEPEFTVGAPAEVETTRAKLSGTVDANGAPTEWSFEVSSDGGASWRPAFVSGFSEGTDPETVEGATTGLDADTTYKVRLAAFSYETYENYVSTGEEEFTTDPAPVDPTATVAPATDVTYTSASVSGAIDPEGGNQESGGAYVPIHWSLELRDTTAETPYESRASGEISAEEPEGGGPIPAASDEPIEIGPIALTELIPGHTYRYYLLTTHAGIPVASTGPIEGFTTTAVAKPTISDIQISHLTSESAHLAAEIDPNAPPGPLDLEAKTAFETTWHFECTPFCAGLQGGFIPAESSGPELQVANDATGLQPNTFYTVRLIASNAGGTSKSTETFRTAGAGPLVNSFAAGPLASTTADLNAEVDPRGSDTVYWFEWGAEDCSAPGANCTSIPATRDASAGSGQLFKYVSRQLTGLTPGATYHFRVLAKSDQGTTEGDDQTFTTAAAEPAQCPNEALRSEQHAAFLPDCRAYEMVSPPDKHGQDVITQTDKTHVAPDGDAVTFSSLGAFAEPQGTNFDSEYLARRTGQSGTNGWSTRGINPLGGTDTFEAVALNQVPGYVDAFTPDLSAAVYLSWRPLTSEPATAEASNLYRVVGLGGAGLAPELLSGSAGVPEPVLPSWPAELKVIFLKTDEVGAADDLSHVVFESPLDLTADAPPYGFFCSFAGFCTEPRLYDSTGADTNLVGRVPSGSEPFCDDQKGPPCEAAPSSQAGISSKSRNYSSRMVSADGSRILFQAPAGTSGGHLYLREDDRRTYKIADSGQLWEASSDLSRAFFITSETLLPADEDGSPDLYMFEVGKPEGERLTLISPGPGEAEVVLGASDDGRYVYFSNNGQLVPGQPQVGIAELFLWHDGRLAYVGALRDSNDAVRNSRRASWAVPSTRIRSRVSPDGRHLLFITRSATGLVGRGGFPGYQQDEHQEFYLYSGGSGRLQCASCNPSGAPAIADPDIEFREAAAASLNTSSHSHALADDGRYVFFTTAEALVPEDTNGYRDAYEYDSRTGQVHLVSSGTEESDSYFISASADGRDAFFATREQLVGWDVDGAYDLYDARIDGGFPEPSPVPAACGGESCLPGVAAVPVPAPTASRATGPGNQKAYCPRGRHRVRRHGKARCVKRAHRRHHKRRHDRTNSDRRASR